MPQPVGKCAIPATQEIPGEGHSDMQLMKIFFTILPQNLLSFMTGKLAKTRFPGPIQFAINKTYALSFGVDESLMEKPMRSYESLTAFFTRRLRPGLRPVDGHLVSPADGRLTNSYPIEGGQTLQAKGMNYSAASLSGEISFEKGWQFTVYLSPKDYHRVHSPVGGELLSIRYIPGKLWPVLPVFVKQMDGLFTFNERLVFEITLPKGGRVFVVMVGSMNVGNMSTRFIKSFATNQNPLKGGEVKTWQINENLSVGDELGMFMLGSTVVVLLDDVAVANGYKPAVQCPLTVITGQSLTE